MTFKLRIVLVSSTRTPNRCLAEAAGRARSVANLQMWSTLEHALLESNRFQKLLTDQVRWIIGRLMRCVRQTLPIASSVRLSMGVADVAVPWSDVVRCSDATKE